MPHDAYFSLDTSNVRDYVASRDTLADRTGPLHSVTPMNEGKLNGVFVAEGERESVVLKQSLPWIRTIPDWPLDPSRLQREVNLFETWATFNAEFVPEVWSLDKDSNILAMEYLEHHVLLRDVLTSESPSDVSYEIGRMIARAGFYTSELFLGSEAFASVSSVEECQDTQNLMYDVAFGIPFLGAPAEMPTEIGALCRDRVRADSQLIDEIRHLGELYADVRESMLHGDLHAGSIMVFRNDVRIIDAEFARYGPLAWDLGAVLGHFMIAAHVHEASGNGRASASVRNMVPSMLSAFRAELDRLVAGSAHGVRASSVEEWSAETIELAVRFSGVEVLRRIVGVGSCEQLQDLPDPVFASTMESLVAAGRTAVVDGAW